MKNVNMVFCWIKEHVKHAAWFYAEACRVEKHVQEYKINMQGQETCARRQEKHAPDRAW